MRPVFCSGTKKKVKAIGLKIALNALELTLVSLSLPFIASSNSKSTDEKHITANLSTTVTTFVLTSSSKSRDRPHTLVRTSKPNSSF